MGLMSFAVVYGGGSAGVSERLLRWACWSLHAVDTNQSSRRGDLPLGMGAVLAG